jgi:hypothetical protein
MYSIKKFALVLQLTLFVVPVFGQSPFRVSEYNPIGWYTTNGVIKVSKKFSFIPDFQWRRNEIIIKPQQDLYRLGLQFTPAKDVWFRVGYGFIETYNYGKYPINALGKQFPEHRIFTGIHLNGQILNKIDVMHRLWYEARWLGHYYNTTSNEVDYWTFVNRLRYMLRLELPLLGNTLDDNEPYLAVYDELFIGFGINVNNNVFDQNRFGALIGWRFNKNFRIEGGYFNQLVQLGRENAAGKNIFQYNRGIIINTIWMIDLSNKK